jgi:isoquinoline 1-oxidoreductase subunit beta
VPEAIGLARATGRPVKLIWTREQDVKSAVLHPQTAHHMEATIDGEGRVSGWHHRIVAEAVTGYSQPARLEAAGGLDPLTLEGSTHQYGIPNQAIDYLRHESGTPLQAWRAIGAAFNKFAIEAFADEIAHAMEEDPVAFRLALLQDNPRARAVVEATAELAGWGRTPEAGRGLGFAYAEVVRSHTAAAVEVSLDEATGVIRVHEVWNVVDPGIVVNPAIVASQLESNVVWGVSQALKERVTLKDGVVEQTNFHDYPILRLSETPAIHTRVIATPNPPSGIGEVSLPLIGAAVSNAVFALTGTRLRHLPFTPDRVKAALG